MSDLFSRTKQEVARRVAVARALADKAARRLGYIPSDNLMEAQRRVAELEIHNATLDVLAFTDYLTELPNRSAWEQQVERILHNNNRPDDVFFFQLDLDNFKQINDTYGHQSGDNALRYVAEVLRVTMRSSDFVARLGGDEIWGLAFLRIPPHLEGAARRAAIERDSMTVMEKVRSGIAAGRFELEETVKIGNAAPRLHRITASIGGAVFNEGESFKDLKERIDAAMYHAKNKKFEKNHGNRSAFSNMVITPDEGAVGSHVVYPPLGPKFELWKPGPTLYTTGPIRFDHDPETRTMATYAPVLPRKFEP